MKSIHSDTWHKLRRAEKRLESLSRELETLESQKQGYLHEIVRGGQLFREVKKADQAIKNKGPYKAGYPQNHPYGQRGIAEGVSGEKEET
jgi:hypothetical protein